MRARPGVLSMVLVPLVVCQLSRPALADELAPDAPRDWFGPQAGDFELGVSGSFGHLFISESTGFDLQIMFGFLVTDWFEIGIAGSVGHLSVASAGRTSTSSPLEVPDATAIGRREQALAAGPVLPPGSSSWYGATELLLRLFPLKLMADNPLPYFLSPYVGVEFGAIYARDLTPFVVLQSVLGLNIYLTDQVALSPEVGHSLIYATDAAISFGEGDGGLEQALSGSWSLSFFF